MPAPVAALLVVAEGEPWCWFFVAEIVGLAFVIFYCRNWLYGRLICLGGAEPDQHAVGLVLKVDSHTDADLSHDNDYRLNLLLQNTELGVTQQQAELSDPFGYLIKHAPEVDAIGLKTPGVDPVEGSATLHVEFEGAGCWNQLQVAQAMLGPAALALAACLFLPWPAGIILAAMLGLAALIGFIVGTATAGKPGKGSPPGTPPMSIHPGVDIVYVEGAWIYDSLHDGWNELHPVKVCTLWGKWDGEWDPDPGAGGTILRLRDAFKVARADETRANQARPEHQWRVHPDVDGCAPVVIT